VNKYAIPVPVNSFS